MIEMPEKPAVYFDVDNTLVFSRAEYPNMHGKTVTIGNREWIVHEKHIECLKDFSGRGHIVVVWSQGGSDWAKAVVEALKIKTYVWMTSAKPSWIFDDKMPSEWIEETRVNFLERDKYL